MSGIEHLLLWGSVQKQSVRAAMCAECNICLIRKLFNSGAEFGHKCGNSMIWHKLSYVLVL